MDEKTLPQPLLRHFTVVDTRRYRPPKTNSKGIAKDAVQAAVRTVKVAKMRKRLELGLDIWNGRRNNEAADNSTWGRVDPYSAVVEE